MELIYSAACPVPPTRAGELLSPPRRWPESFREDKSPLAAFIGAPAIRGRRCRLTGPPSPAMRAAAAAVEIVATDAAANASRVAGALGWTTATGFALYELKVHTTPSDLSVSPSLPDPDSSFHPHL